MTFMSTIYEKALEKHGEWQGKISTELKMPLETRDDLSVAYTPGVAEPCRQIHKNPDDVYKYTWKGNTIAVVSDGTAVLGLGDIGALQNDVFRRDAGGLSGLLVHLVPLTEGEHSGGRQLLDGRHIHLPPDG